MDIIFNDVILKRPISKKGSMQEQYEHLSPNLKKFPRNFSRVYHSNQSTSPCEGIGTPSGNNTNHLCSPTARSTTKPTLPSNRLSTESENRVKTEISEKNINDMDKYRRMISNPRLLNTKKQNQEYWKISNYFDKKQVQDSVMHADSVDEKIKVIDYILKKRNELQNLASKIAATKTAPVIKDFRDKFKLKQTISKKKDMMPPSTSSSSNQTMKDSTGLFFNSRNLSLAGKPSKNIWSDTPSANNERSPNCFPIIKIDNSTIIESESSSALCSFIDTSRLFESALKARDNLKYDDEYVLKHIAYMQTSKSRIISDSKDQKSSNLKKDYTTPQQNTKNIVMKKTSSRSSLHQLNNLHPNLSPHEVLNSDKNLKKPDELMELSPNMLESIWTFENEHNSHEHLKDKYIDKMNGKSTLLSKLASKAAIKLKQQKEDKDYIEYAKKMLEKDLIKYSLLSTRGGKEQQDIIVIDPTKTSNKTLKQIETRAKIKLETLFQEQLGLRKRLLRKVNEQKTESSVISGNGSGGYGYENTQNQHCKTIPDEDYSNLGSPMNFNSMMTIYERQSELRKGKDNNGGNGYKRPNILKMMILPKSCSTNRFGKLKKLSSYESSGFQTECSSNNPNKQTSPTPSIINYTDQKIIDLENDNLKPKDPIKDMYNMNIGIPYKNNTHTRK